MATTCRTCGAPIEFVTSAKSGKLIPLDAASQQVDMFKPQPTIVLNLSELRGKLVVLPGEGARPATLEDVKLGRPLRVSHFSTCKDAAEWRGHR